MLMLLSRVQLKIDYTRLANLASNQLKKDVAIYLIGFEKDVEKKIPFFMEVKQYKEALKIAIEVGDPNIVGKVIT